MTLKRRRRGGINKPRELSNLNTRFTTHQMWSNRKTHKPNKGQRHTHTGIVEQTAQLIKTLLCEHIDVQKKNRHTDLHTVTNTNTPLQRLSHLPLAHSV